MKEQSSELKERIERIGQGDQAAMQEVFQEHGKACIDFLQQYSRSCAYDTAEDIMMETMLSFFEIVKTGKGRQVRNLRNYLLTSCRNYFLKQKKKERRPQEKQVELERYYYDYLRLYPDVLWEKKEHRKWLRVNAALDNLGEKCRTLVRMFYLDRLPMKDIATQLGLANDKVAKSSKARCMKQLRELVSDTDKND